MKKILSVGIILSSQKTVHSLEGKVVCQSHGHIMDIGLATSEYISILQSITWCMTYYVYISSHTYIQGDTHTVIVLIYT